MKSPLSFDESAKLEMKYFRDNILDPFMGIGSTAWVALEQGRNAVGFELKDSYYHISIKNINKIAANCNTEVNLFSEIEY